MPVTVTCIRGASYRNLMRASVSQLIIIVPAHIHIVTSIQHRKNMHHVCSHVQENFGMEYKIPYTSFMATCVFENMVLFGCMHFLCGQPEIEKLQSKFQSKQGKVEGEVREDNTGGQCLLRKYNIMTETSCNCRNMSETSDDVYPARGPKITSDHKGHGPFSTVAAAFCSMVRCSTTVKPAPWCVNMNTAHEGCTKLGCIQ